MVLDYDLVVLGMALAFLVAHANTAGFLPWEKTLLAFAWSAPLVARSLAKLAFLAVGLMALGSTLALAVIHALVELRTSRRTQEFKANGLPRAITSDRHPPLFPYSK